ncbi:hypothetical protein [Nocardia transvalensis]|uniref:hypothetical protein n=1 Tax=Nocardia transvalensis TaxID=37333 RepID=UPI0018940708|nr:hypothetical protein [Nocardia transvalensis]MBF6332317.1 hypothetical protein [Nocardia transvalensis]
MTTPLTAHDLDALPVGKRVYDATGRPWTKLSDQRWVSSDLAERPLFHHWAQTSASLTGIDASQDGYGWARAFTLAPDPARLTITDGVEAVMSAAGQLPGTPTIPTEQTLAGKLRRTFALLCDLLNACGLDVIDMLDADESIDPATTLADQLSPATFNTVGVVNANLGFITTATGDLLQVAGPAATREVMSEVVRAIVATINHDGTVTVGDDGTIILPEGWEAADITGVLTRYGAKVARCHNVRQEENA